MAGYIYNDEFVCFNCHTPSCIPTGPNIWTVSSCAGAEKQQAMALHSSSKFHRTPKKGCKGSAKAEALAKKKISKLVKTSKHIDTIAKEIADVMDGHWILRALCTAGVPFAFITIVRVILASPTLNTDRNLALVEYFAGRREVTKAQWRNGKLAIAFEIDDDAELGDILSDWGYIHAIVLALKVGPTGGSLAAIVCSTWVWLSRGSTGSHPT